MPDSIDNAERSAPEAIILAAGKGTRMGDAGDLPKVMHPVAGRPMLAWVIDACKQAGAARCVLVVGYKGELVREAFGNDPACTFVEQTELLGTGHAAKMAQPLYIDKPPVDLFVLAGDGPLIRAKTLARLLEVHRRRRAAATLATSIIDDPAGYGRVVRTKTGEFETIVEQKDATPQQLAIREINPSYYCFRSDGLFSALADLKTDNAQGEYYITDVPALLKTQGQGVAVIDAVPPEDVLSINTPEQLAEVGRVLRDRIQASNPAEQLRA